MTRSFKLSAALLAVALALPVHAHAQEAPKVQIRAFKIKGRVNPGDLAYNWVFEDQQRLQNYLPARNRMVDFSWRVSFTELNLPEQDSFTPKGWAVALVANDFERDVPVARGGYFLLPALPQGRRGSTIMFHEQSLPGHIGAAWRIRVGADQRLSYAGFKQAMDEVHRAQGMILPQYEGLRMVRDSRYDALKACFLERGGEVLVDGIAAADASVGNCTILKFDPAWAAAAHTIEFKGRLDLVTVVESAAYDTYLDAQALAGTESAAPAPGAGIAPEAFENAPTNLSNRMYGWNFKRQQRMQSVVPPRSHLVNFVWRLSLDGLSEAEQDAWTPPSWALALAGKDFARPVPVARGGYFLLPALPRVRQDAALTFKEQEKRNVVSAAWVVRPRDGENPYLYYGEIKEAMNAVHRTQASLPDGNPDLAALRAVHYDGLKACFLEDGGAVFVEGYRTADATVGNCRILKFNPGENVNQKIEFVGRLDAVTLVDTAHYLPAKG
jgi:hypothetical protein